MRGESGASFNLLSTPLLSLNAEFRAVPPAFRGLDITETVLGSMHLSLCAAPGEAASTLEMDVDSGNITTHDWSAPMRAEEERYICDLREMRYASALSHLGALAGALRAHALPSVHPLSSIRNPLAGALGGWPGCCRGAGWRRRW